MAKQEESSSNIKIRLLRESDLDEADRVTRLAFGTFLGLPDPMAFLGDISMIHTRWKADPRCAVCAEVSGNLAGSCFATRWGSVGFLGPLTVRPDYWDKGVAQELLGATLEKFQEWGTDVVGLFTFSNSLKHIYLYQKFGFWPRQLTALMSKPVSKPAIGPRWTAYSQASSSDREGLAEQCRNLTNEIYPGLDLADEMLAVVNQNLGETVLLWDAGNLAGLAVCHVGAGTEAGSDACYLKFAAVQPGRGAGEYFELLLDSCEALATERGVGKINAGINTSHHDAYRRLLARGFRASVLGVVMQRDNKIGYRTPENYVIDDWR